MFKGKVEFIVLVDQFGISHVTDKCLCVQCLVAIQELFTSPRMMHMIPTTMILDLFTKF